MNLEQFLLTADPDHSVARQQARDFVVLEPQFITSNTLTVYVVRKSLYAFLADQAQIESPVRSICMALMDRLRGVSDFNLSASLPLGQANRQMLYTLITYFSQTHPEESIKLAELKDELEMISEKATYPLERTTLHDVMIVRNDCPRKPVEVVNGWVTITISSEVERHNPRLLAQSPRTGKWQRVGNFMGVEAAGVYECRVPREFVGWPLAVDDPYGAVV